jgi:hypothetical protein
MVSFEPFLTVRAVQPLISGLTAMGHDPKPLLALARLDESMLHDPDSRVPMRIVMSLIARAVEATGDANLGLHLAEHTDVGSADVHVYAIVSSPTLGAAYERICRYQRLIHETNLVELNRQGERAWLRHRRPGGLAAPRHTAEFLLAVWVRAGRIATGTDWAPLEVRFAHAEPRMKQGAITTHGFRSSVRDWTAERTNFPRAVCESALAHSLRDKTDAADNRTDRFERRRELMTTWAKRKNTKTSRADRNGFVIQDTNSSLHLLAREVASNCYLELN